MIEKEIDPQNYSSILTFLKNQDLFKDSPPDFLEALLKSMTYVSIRGGDIVIHQGEVDPTLYILWHGRLRVYTKDPTENTIEEIAEIASGEVVGELTFITGEPRVATVMAVRDSLLFKLRKDNFDQLEKLYPRALISIAKMALIRLTRKVHRTTLGEKVKTIVVAPAGSSSTTGFLQKLFNELNAIRPTILINSETLNAHFGKKVSESLPQDLDHDEISSYLLALENRFGYVIYETDKVMNYWTERCLRQADFVFLVAEEKSDHDGNSIEKALFQKANSLTHPCVEMVFMHSSEKTDLSGTHLWLKERKVHGYHHVRLDSKKDFEKLIRFLTGKAFGVVLNGGGVRGFVHIGVIKALLELQIPIDFIGGTSIGAVVGAVLAKYGIEKALDIYRKIEFGLSSKDYTFPIVALFRGKNINDLLKKYCEDSYIEDLWTRFFCVSTNVTESKIEIHDKGPLWLALRASSALPALYPPIYDEKGNMLVDGGVLNNMPVDVMRELLDGGKILAINCRIKANLETRKKTKDTWISGWKLFFDRLNPFLKKKRQSYNNIVSILRTTMILGSDDKQKQMAKEADFLLEFDTSKYKLLRFEDMNELVDLGYSVAMQKLPLLFAEQNFSPLNHI